MQSRSRGNEAMKGEKKTGGRGKNAAKEAERRAGPVVGTHK